MQIILGSTSPRRKEILEAFSIPFKQVSPSFDEEAAPIFEDPKAYASSLAIGKAKSLIEKYPDMPILTADTVVFLEGKYFGKALSEDEAFHALKALQNKCHEVVTALALYYKGGLFTESEKSMVHIKSLTDLQIKSYLKTVPYLDKAGSYMVQLPGGLIVQRIEGCYYNVVGLPIHSLESILKKINIDLWQHL